MEGKPKPMGGRGIIDRWFEKQQDDVTTHVMPEIVDVPQPRGAMRILMALGIVGDQPLTESVEEVAAALQEQGVSSEAIQAWTKKQLRPLYAKAALKEAAEKRRR